MIRFDHPFVLPDQSGTPGKRADVKPMTAEQKKLYKACNDFEMVMVKQMLVAMQGSASNFGKGFGGDYFEGLFQDEMAKDISGQGMGLRDILYRQLTKSGAPSGAPTGATAVEDSQIKSGK